MELGLAGKAADCLPYQSDPPTEEERARYSPMHRFTTRLGGETLDEFLRQFPSVRRDQAIAALNLARTTLLAGARSS